MTEAVRAIKSSLQPAFTFELPKILFKLIRHRVGDFQMLQAAENILELLADDLHYWPTIRYSRTSARSTRLWVPKW